MGIRIHTAMGWGLKKTKGSKDPRFTPEFLKMWDDEVDLRPLLKKRCEELISVDTTNDDEADINKSYAQMFLQRLSVNENHLGVRNMVRYCSEMDSGPMVFVPFPYIDTWFRYDDAIDYYDSLAKNKVKMLVDDAGFPISIWPYYGHVNRKTGRPFRGKNARMYIEARQMIPLIEKSGKKVKTLSDLISERGVKELKEEYGIDSLDALVNDLVPEIPFELKLFFEVTHAFKDPLTMYELRPMIYKYWC